jgi:hypothetical protein
MRKKLGLLTVGVLLLGLIFPLLPTFAGDFHDFYMAGRMIVEGRSPYEWSRYYNPIWVAFGFAPLALLDEGLAYRVFLIPSILGYIFVMWKCCGGDKVALLISLATPFFVMQLFWGQIDWIVLLGLVVRPEIGLFFALTKPQIGIFLAALLFWQIWQHRGRWYALRVAALVAMALGVSMIAGMHIPDMRQLEAWSTDIFPWGLPVGLFLVWRAFRGKGNAALALAGGPFVSTYVALPSWVAVVPIALKKRSALLIVLIASWIVAVAQFSDALASLSYGR